MYQSILHWPYALKLGCPRGGPRNHWNSNVFPISSQLMKSIPKEPPNRLKWSPKSSLGPSKYRKRAKSKIYQTTPYLLCFQHIQPSSLGGLCTLKPHKKQHCNSTCHSDIQNIETVQKRDAQVPPKRNPKTIQNPSTLSKSLDLFLEGGCTLPLTPCLENLFAGHLDNLFVSGARFAPKYAYVLHGTFKNKCI